MLDCVSGCFIEGKLVGMRRFELPTPYSRITTSNYKSL